DLRVGLLAVEDLGDHREVPQPRVRRGAHHDLRDLLAGDLGDRHHIAGGGGFGDQRLQLRQLDVLGQVVARALVGLPGLALVAAAPSSAPMLAITCRSIASSCASPGPWYSMMRPTPPLTPWRRSISSTTSLAETQSGRSPVSSTPQISGSATYSGWPAIAIAT